MNDQQLPRKAKAGLFDKLLLLHLLSITLLFIFVVIAYSQLQANNFSRAFVDKSTLIRELLETTCIDPVVNTIAYDRTGKIIEALYRKNPSIAYIEIYDPTARIISSIGTSPKNHITVEQIVHQFQKKSDSEPQSTLKLKETEFITSLSANGSTLGLVRVGMTKTFLQQQMKDNFLYFLGIFLVAISVTSLLYYFFTKRWILKPIIKLSTMMKNYRQDDLPAINQEIVDYNKTQTKDEIGIMSHAFGQMVFSITEYTEEIKRAEKKLSQRELKYRTLMDNQSDAILLHPLHPLHPDGFFNFSEVNNAAINYYGYSREEFLQLSTASLTSPAEVEKLVLPAARKMLLEQSRTILETVHVKKSGEQFPVEINATLVELDDQKYILSTVRDITARKQAERQRLDLETQLRQKFKMEAVGTMAGGIAHNFNNSLAIVIGSLEMVARKKDQPDKVEEYLKNARIALTRARDLVSQIMTYSRRGNLKKNPLQLSLIIDETLKLISATSPTTIQLDQKISTDSTYVTIHANASQIQEVLLNLYGNAVHAMEEKGELLIILDVVELTDKDLPDLEQNKPGRYAKISIQDNGCGMSIETQEKIFDPFFTTKEMYEGTGMGLATVQGIINQHGGLIKVNSTLGEGTTFDLYFPVIEKPQSVEPTPINVELPGGTEKILFIDDDEILANLGAVMLTEMGYQVTMMTESQEALKLFTANPDHFDLVITDQTMPDLTGKDLIQELKKIRPALRTILCTGYSSKIDEDQAKQQGIDAFCMKPLDLPELLQAVRRALGDA